MYTKIDLLSLSGTVQLTTGLNIVVDETGNPLLVPAKILVASGSIQQLVPLVGGTEFTAGLSAIPGGPIILPFSFSSPPPPYDAAAVAQGIMLFNIGPVLDPMYITIESVGTWTSGKLYVSLQYIDAMHA